MTTIKVPCEDCLILAKCKNKSVRKATRECSILDEFIEKHSRRNKPEGIRLVLASVMHSIEDVLEKGLHK